MNNKINILLIEDNPGDVRLVQEELKNITGYEINLLIADSLARAKKLIAAENVQVILLDLNLPDSGGIDTFHEAHKFAIGVPVIIMSILSDKELIFQAMKEGAQAYLIKGQIESDSLLRAVRYACWSCHATY